MNKLREPDQTNLLVRASELASATIIGLGDKNVLADEWTDVEALALGFAVLRDDLVNMMTYNPDGGGRCGWCVAAAGNDQDAWDAAENGFETRDELVAHSTSCEHNPLVRRVRELERLAAALVIGDAQ